MSKDHDETAIEAMNRLSEEVHRLSSQGFFAHHQSWLRMIWFNLVRGLFFGLGSVIGATLLVYVLISILSQFDFIPVIGEWANQIIAIIETNGQS